MSKFIGQQGWVKILIKPNVTTLFDTDQTFCIRMQNICAALECEGMSVLFSLLQNIDFIVYVCFYFSSIGWRHGLQAVTGVVFLTFVLGTFYRSASLYHPQRRAILHLKSQKRKIKSKDKEKNKIQDDTPPFFDFTTLKSRTVQLLLLSVGVGSFGLNSPIFYLVSHTSVFG